MRLELVMVELEGQTLLAFYSIPEEDAAAAIPGFELVLETLRIEATKAGKGGP